MNTLPRLFAFKDFVRSCKTSVSVSDTYGATSKWTSLFKCTAERAINVEA